jgi:hypothetical protein
MTTVLYGSVTIMQKSRRGPGEGGESGHSVLKAAFLGVLAQRYVAGHRD